MNDNTLAAIKAKIEDIFDIFSEGLIDENEFQRRIGAYCLHVVSELGVTYEQYASIVQEVKKIKGYK